MTPSYSLGYLPDLEDTRDFRYSTAPIILPTSVDYTPFMSPVKNQGNRKSCVAFAMCAVREFQTGSKDDLSEEFLYQLSSETGGGTKPRNACKVLQRIGVSREKFWPYEKRKDPVSTKYVVDLTEHRRALADARRWRIDRYVQLRTVEEMKQSLVENGPFVMGLDWDRSWFTQWIMDVPRKKEIVGGHMVCVVGFTKNIIHIKNSWGRKWGDEGYNSITEKTLLWANARCWALYGSQKKV